MKAKSIRAVLFLVALTAGWLPAAFAHEGHQHHVMGTVASINEHKIEITTTDGKAVTVVLAKSTKVVRGKEPAAIKDIKRGARVVVETEGVPDKLTATVVHLAVESK